MIDITSLRKEYAGILVQAGKTREALQEYKQLYEATRKRANNPPSPRWKWQCEQMHDYVLFMVNTGLRPDESSRLELRAVAAQAAQMPTLWFYEPQNR